MRRKTVERAKVAAALKKAAFFLEKADAEGDIYDEFAMAALLGGARTLKDLIESENPDTVSSVETGQTTGHKVHAEA